MQDASLRAFRFFDGMHGRAPKAWFIAIVRNACLDWIGARKRRGIEESYDEAAHGGALLECGRPGGVAGALAARAGDARPARLHRRPPVRVPRGPDPARDGRDVVPGDQRGRRRADRHRHVAALPRPRAACAPGRARSCERPLELRPLHAGARCRPRRRAGPGTHAELESTSPPARPARSSAPSGCAARALRAAPRFQAPARLTGDPTSRCPVRTGASGRRLAGATSPGRGSRVGRPHVGGCPRAGLVGWRSTASCRRPRPVDCPARRIAASDRLYEWRRAIVTWSSPGLLGRSLSHRRSATSARTALR